MASDFPAAAVFESDDLRTGLTAQFEREITKEDIYAFAHLSGDANPLHVDATYAADTNYGGPIVHGAFQVALASAMIGMHLPGRNVLLGGFSARFPKPLYYPVRVRVTGTILSWTSESRSGTLRVNIVNKETEVSTAEIHLTFTLHEKHMPAATALPRASPAIDSDRKIVLVTGASGGIGSEIVMDLAQSYCVLAQSRRSGVTSGEHVIPVVTDLDDAGMSNAVEEALAGRALFAVVHAAWPGQPTGGLLETDTGILDQQVLFATSRTVSLARLLAAHASEGGRFIALGSIVATQKPVLTYSAYSLGKAALEHTVRLLAPELARKQITANVVSPSFVPTGMNRQSTERQRLKETALVPMGRLCAPADVAAMVRYLLSPAAAFVSGQTIVLSGGQL